MAVPVIIATVQALFDFNLDGSTPNCITFSQDDIIYVYERMDNGWWQGVLSTSVAVNGWFPANYVKVIAEGPPSEAPAQTADSTSTSTGKTSIESTSEVTAESNKSAAGHEDGDDLDETTEDTTTTTDETSNIFAAKALIDYVPNAYDKDALSFRKGDMIAVLEMNPTGQWKGFIDGREGYFPSRYVKLEESSVPEVKEFKASFVRRLSIGSSLNKFGQDISAPASPIPSKPNIVIPHQPQKAAMPLPPKPWKWTRTPDGKDYLYNPETFDRAWTVADIEFGPGEDLSPAPAAAAAAPVNERKDSHSLQNLSSNSGSLIDLSEDTPPPTYTSTLKRRPSAPGPPRVEQAPTAPPPTRAKPTIVTGAQTAMLVDHEVEAIDRARREEEEKKRLEIMLKETRERLAEEQRRAEQMTKEAEERRKERERLEAEARAAEARARVEREEAERQAAAKAAEAMAKMADRQRQEAAEKRTREQAAREVQERQSMELKLRELEERLATERARAERLERAEREKREQEELLRQQRQQEMEEQQQKLLEQARHEAEEKRRIEQQLALQAERLRLEKEEMERKLKADMERMTREKEAKVAEERAKMQEQLAEMERRMAEEKIRMEKYQREQLAQKAAEQEQLARVQMQRQLMEAEARLAAERKRNEEIEAQRALAEMERQLELERQSLENAVRSLESIPPVPKLPPPIINFPPLPPPPAFAHGGPPNLPPPPPIATDQTKKARPLSTLLDSLSLPQLPSPSPTSISPVVVAAARMAAAKKEAAAAAASAKVPPPVQMLPPPPTPVYRLSTKQEVEATLHKIGQRVDEVFSNFLEAGRVGNVEAFVQGMKDATSAVRELLTIASSTEQTSPLKAKLSMFMSALSAALKSLLISAKQLASAIETGQPRNHLLPQIEKIASDALIAKYDLIDFILSNAAQLFGFKDPMREVYETWLRTMEGHVESLTGSIKYLASVAKSGMSIHYQEGAASVIAMVSEMRIFLHNVISATNDFTMKQNLNFSLMQLADAITLLVQAASTASRLNTQDSVQGMVNAAVKLARITKECGAVIQAKLVN